MTIAKQTRPKTSQDPVAKSPGPYEEMHEVCHSLRSSLVGPLEFTSILMTEISGPLNEDQHAHLNLALAGVRTLSYQIAELTDVTLIAANEFRISKRIDSLEASLERILQVQNATIQLKEIQLTKDWPSSWQTFNLDVPRVEGLLYEILNHACRYARVKSQIEFRIKLVADAGEGSYVVEVISHNSMAEPTNGLAVKTKSWPKVGFETCPILAQALGFNYRYEADGKRSSYRLRIPLGGQ